MRPYCSTEDPLLALRPCLSKPRWQNLVLLVLALTLAHTFVLWQVAVAVLLPLRLESCYQRLKRLRGWTGVDWDRLQRAWIRWVLDPFTQPGQLLVVYVRDPQQQNRVTRVILGPGNDPQALISRGR